MQEIGMPSPHGDCEPSSDYVQTKCLARCEADYVIDNCSCKLVHMPGEITKMGKYRCLLVFTRPKHCPRWCALSSSAI